MKRFLYKVVTDQVNGRAISVLKGFLWVLSKVYAGIIGLRGLLYRIRLFKRYPLSAPAISVGNLTMGGSGKTPLVEFIAKELRKRNIQPVILMRGYTDQGAQGQGRDNDEAAMLRRSLSDVPILVGVDRVKSAEVFSKENKEILSKEIKEITKEALKISQQGIIAAMEGMKVRKNQINLYHSLEITHMVCIVMSWICCTNSIDQQKCQRMVCQCTISIVSWMQTMCITWRCKDR